MLRTPSCRRHRAEDANGHDSVAGTSGSVRAPQKSYATSTVRVCSTHSRHSTQLLQTWLHALRACTPCRRPLDLSLGDDVNFLIGRTAADRTHPHTSNHIPGQPLTLLTTPRQHKDPCAVRWGTRSSSSACAHAGSKAPPSRGRVSPGRSRACKAAEFRCAQIRRSARQDRTSSSGTDRTTPTALVGRTRAHSDTWHH
eukprot:COSAG01_NODE_8320_length_2831_cov_2.616032_1_plen_198_part_00